MIQRAAAGEIVLPSRDVAEVFGTLQRAASYRSDGLRLLGLLTSREIEILKLVAQGNSTAEIAKQFFISPFTVQSHVRNILSKLGVHSKLEAVTFALRHGAINVSGADAVAQSRRR